MESHPRITRPVVYGDARRTRETEDFMWNLVYTITGVNAHTEVHRRRTYIHIPINICIQTYTEGRDMCISTYEEQSLLVSVSASVGQLDLYLSYSPAA